jgi:hypothetical protein
MSVQKAPAANGVTLWEPGGLFPNGGLSRRLPPSLAARSPYYKIPVGQHTCVERLPPRAVAFPSNGVHALAHRLVGPAPPAPSLSPTPNSATRSASS